MNSKSGIDNITNWAIKSLVFGYILLLIVLPLEQVCEKAFSAGLDGFIDKLCSPSALFALKFTIILAFIAAVINALGGTFIALVLERYPIPGKTFLNAMVDIPLAIPTAVSGIMLIILYGPQSPIGDWFNNNGIELIYAAPGIVLAMIFVTFPFTVRSVQPLLSAVDKETEEVAKTLGASKWQIFRRLILPSILPGILSGFTLAFSRAIAEFGSVVMVAGNIPMKTQVASVFIYGEVESSNLTGASVMSFMLLTFTLFLSLVQGFLSNRSLRQRIFSKICCLFEMGDRFGRGRYLCKDR